MPVHVYGHSCDVEAIQRIANEYNLKVIYDAAHTFGVKKNGRCLAEYGDASIYSFHATKLFNSIEGGAIVYSNDRYTKSFNMYKNFGIEDEESIPLIGGNAKMNEFQAAMGLANLPALPFIIQQRKEYTEYYRRRLEGIRGIRLFHPDQDPSVEYNYAYLPIVITEEARMNRDELTLKLKEDNIFVRKYFYPLISECACYRNLPSAMDLPVAKKAAMQIITLPLYTDMGFDTIDVVCDRIKTYLED